MYFNWRRGYISVGEGGLLQLEWGGGISVGEVILQLEEGVYFNRRLGFYFNWRRGCIWAGVGGGVVMYEGPKFS